MNKETSWGKVAKWYDELIVNDTDSYQKNVILPNLIRIIEVKQSLNILDIACGQGYFSSAFADLGANVQACDISSELIAIAKERSNSQNIGGKIHFFVSPSHEIKTIENNSLDIITIILALQNIEKINETIKECSRILKPAGKIIIVLNHPAFRIPQNSSWQWDEKDNKQFRRIDSYMSEENIKIDMTPGEQNISKKKYTVSFHRPLQIYFKALNRCGLTISRLEEWISHKSSQKGPRANEEDRMRKEIPMFLCIEGKKN
jgi:ubiquinone/menaquinone biosynthesis C-methylase UbiE